MFKAQQGSNRQAAVALMNLGVAFGAEHPGRMKELLEESLVLFRRECGPNHPEVAVALTNIVAAQIALGEYANARVTAVDASNIARAAFPFPNSAVSEIALNLAASAQAMGDSEALTGWL